GCGGLWRMYSRGPPTISGSNCCVEVSASSPTRLASALASANPPITFSVYAFCAVIHCFTAGASASSSQRYGSCTTLPKNVSVTSCCAVGGGIAGISWRVSISDWSRPAPVVGGGVCAQATPLNKAKPKPASGEMRRMAGLPFEECRQVSARAAVAPRVRHAGRSGLSALARANHVWLRCGLLLGDDSMNRFAVAGLVCLLASASALAAAPQGTASAAPANAAQKLTLERIMADPDWIGPPVEDEYWS